MNLTDDRIFRPSLARGNNAAACTTNTGARMRQGRGRKMSMRRPQPDGITGPAAEMRRAWRASTSLTVTRTSRAPEVTRGGRPKKVAVAAWPNSCAITDASPAIGRSAATKASVQNPKPRIIQAVPIPKGTHTISAGVKAPRLWTATRPISLSIETGSRRARDAGSPREGRSRHTCERSQARKNEWDECSAGQG